jgi:purine-binding chemotaxis protein CheW
VGHDRYDRLVVRPCLVFSAAARRCAIPLEHVIETMRPLPVEPIRSESRFVRGAACIRGDVVPVVDVGALAFGAELGDGGRFVTIRAGAGVVALAVDAIEGVTSLAKSELADMPPLLGADLIERIVRVDEGLVMVLRAARLASEATSG